MITARINNNKTYNLIRWDSQDFNANLTLYIQSIDLQDVKETFTNVELLEIFRETRLVASYTSLDTFSQITYLGMDYCEAENRFVDSMSVTLTKLNIADQIQRLDDQINKTVDPTTLGLEDLRAYKLQEISEACRQDIYDGAVIELSDGTSEKFSYNQEDQENLSSLLSLILIAKDIDALPWHSDGHFCRAFSRIDIITICSTLLLRKTQLTTYANAMNMYIGSINTREELLDVHYGMELPDEYAQNIAVVMGLTLTELEKFMAMIIDPAEPEDEPIDDGQDEPIDDGQDEPGDDGDDEPEDPGDESSDDEEE